MLWNDVAFLVWVDNLKNNMGDMVPTEVKRQVFVNKKSVRASEFYQAMATGLKPELILEVRRSDYLDETQLMYNSRMYNIIRTHEKNTEIIELICEGVVGQHTRGETTLDSEVDLDTDYILKGSTLVGDK